MLLGPWAERIDKPLRFRWPEDSVYRYSLLQQKAYKQRTEFRQETRRSLEQKETDFTWEDQHH